MVTTYISEYLSKVALKFCSSQSIMCMCNDSNPSALLQYLHCTDNIKEDNGNERYCEIFIGLTALFTTTSAIATAIIVVLSWKLYNQHKIKGKYI